MAQPTTAKIRLLWFLGSLCAFASLVFLVLWPLSYQYYTTLGLDMDRADGPEAVYYCYYRIRWPGDGSFRIGGGAHHYARGAKRIEPFDLGGRFFQPPRRDIPRSWWNRIGFWWFDTHSEDYWSGRDNALAKPWQFWIGIPSVLPGVFLGGFAWYCWRLIRRQRTGSARASA